MKVTREREVAKALELIGAVKKAGCPVETVGKAVTIWVLHNQKDYQNHTTVSKFQNKFPKKDTKIIPQHFKILENIEMLELTLIKTKLPMLILKYFFNLNNF